MPVLKTTSRDKLALGELSLCGRSPACSSCLMRSSSHWMRSGGTGRVAFEGVVVSQVHAPPRDLFWHGSHTGPGSVQRDSCHSHTFKRVSPGARPSHLICTGDGKFCGRPLRMLTYLSSPTRIACDSDFLSFHSESIHLLEAKSSRVLISFSFEDADRP